MKKKITTAIGMLVCFMMMASMAWALEIPGSGRAAMQKYEEDQERQRYAPIPRWSLPTRVIPGGPNGTVTDGNLVWLQNADCFGRRNWNDAMNSAASLRSGMCGLSDGSEAGQWRLPTLEELKRRVRNMQGFNNVQSSIYWSSSTFAGNTSDAWIVVINGEAGNHPKGSYYYVWPVRYVQ